MKKVVYKDKGVALGWLRLPFQGDDQAETFSNNQN
jgi:hypothetical protein